YGINDAGTIVGNYQGPGGSGFSLSGGIYTSLDYPALGINDAGQIVGNYVLGTGYGFLKDGNTYTSIIYPGSNFTQPYGINDAGDIVGIYSDASGNYGFLATVPEPAAMFLLGIGLIGVTGLRRKVKTQRNT
ncbi:MAG: PEP-CTERM sorting domain-containing protein, partial [Syntrophales bacterium LBB04]|nr:PEP-CTERM sorting domain-containing protein [Syntrophales bacterium LBB04]